MYQVGVNEEVALKLHPVFSYKKELVDLKKYDLVATGNKMFYNKISLTIQSKKLHPYICIQGLSLILSYLTCVMSLAEHLSNKKDKNYCQP